MTTSTSKIAIYGSTGSIGQQTLDIMRRHRDQFELVAIIAHRNVDTLVQQCIEFKPQYIGLNDEKKVAELKQLLTKHHLNPELLIGHQAISQFASAVDYDTMVAGITGSAGLASVYQAVCSGKHILLANKECLVMAGQFIIEQAKQHHANIIPIDSEHNALFQCLNATSLNDPCNILDSVDHIVLTASGGPFLHTPLNELADVTIEQASCHPNWEMGQKISIDSATMMNKGLEVIEAHWLFELPATKIKVLIHPQSIIHGFVHLHDGSVLTQMAEPDMRVPIANALAHPKRIASGAKPLNLAGQQLTFFDPDNLRFPCLSLAYQAIEAGTAQSTVLNATNEIAVQAFIESKIQFTDISMINQQGLELYNGSSYPSSIEEMLIIDKETRIRAEQIITKR